MTKAVIFGCSGFELTAEERDFFAGEQPLGFILFARNIDNPSQVKALVETLKSCVEHDDVPILIDQEGGRVARLREPHWRHPLPAQVFGDMYEHTPEKAIQATYLNHRLMAEDLLALGINVDCAPMLDVRSTVGHDIVGDRAFSTDPMVVSTLGKAAMEGIMAGGVTPIIKHIPGHGLARCDSHEELPVVSESLQDLMPHLKPFKMNANAPWAMTAHILFESIDPQNVATQSSVVIESVIRDHIGFDGFLVSDDLGMKALSGSWAEKTERSLEAGCDAVLHCSGVMDEMVDVAEAASALSNESRERMTLTARSEASFDPKAACEILDTMVGARKAS